jgi:hypothetical protein
MSDEKRTVDLRYDTTRQVLLNSSGEPMYSEKDPEWPTVTFREQSIFRVRLYTYDRTTKELSADTRFDLAAITQFEFAADIDFDRATGPALQTLTAGINATGDWASADAAAGLFSVQVDAETQQFDDQTDGKRSVPAYAEIKAFNESGDMIASVSGIPVLLLSLVTDSSSPPDDIATNFYTKTETDAAFARRDGPTGYAEKMVTYDGKLYWAQLVGTAWVIRLTIVSDGVYTVRYVEV